MSLDSLRWFSQHRSRRQVLCIRWVPCDVSAAHLALFTFCVMRRDSAKRHIFGCCAPLRGLWLLSSNSAKIFVQCAYLPLSSSYVYSFWSYHVDKQTHLHTNKQMPLKTSNALRYAMTLGNNRYNLQFISDVTADGCNCCLSSNDLRARQQLLPELGNKL